MNDFKQFKGQRLAQAALECEKQLSEANTQLMQVRQHHSGLNQSMRLPSHSSETGHTSLGRCWAYGLSCVLCGFHNHEPLIN